ncbi:MAG TPA: phosphate ABC transporter substrate-binding protein PstS [Stenomitos sp.]
MMSFPSTVVRRVFTVSFATLAMSVTPYLTVIAQAVTLNGAGATFPAPLYERYIREFQSKNPDITVNYQGIGSGGGRRAMFNGSVDFGGSDAAMTDDEIDKVHLNRGVLMIPTCGGAVAVVYNVPGVSSGLKLSQSTLASIFSAKITKWNDPKIASANPGVNLPDQPIRLVVRADSSGTTFIFTNALSAMSSAFQGQIGVNQAPQWAGNPLKGKGNPGVAATVQQTPGSIGYVEYSYAKQNNLNFAAVQNKKGEYMLPTLEATQEALSKVKFPSNFRVFEGNPASGYPIAGMTWMLLYKKYDAEKLPAIKKWMTWILTEGQQLNGSLDYIKVPPDVAKRALDKVNSDIQLWSK